MTIDFQGFARSRTGAGFFIFALFCALISAGAGYATYSIGLRSYTADKREEKVTALELVDAFVTNYSAIRGQLASEAAPVPATFRAHSIELFNRMRSTEGTLRLVWVGRTDRAIATPPSDAAMAETIEAFAIDPSPKPVSRFLTLPSGTVFRTVYPSIATQQSCVDCHNRLQPDKAQWRLNEVMGAFAIDVPAGPFLRSNVLRSAGFALTLFAALCGTGLIVAVMSYRRGEELREAERKQDELQRHLQQNQKMEALGTLAGGIAHDLNNALVPVLALSAQVMKNVPNQGRAHDNLRLIHKSGERARDLVRQILTFARKTEPQRGLVDAVAFTAGALKLLRSSIPTTITIRSRLEPVAPIWADESQLYQILLNLVTNAAQAIGDRMGVITVETATVTNGPLGGGKLALRLSVSDNGSGMDETTRERIFEPFFTTKPVNEGTGLGLSVVHGIVAAHGGAITLESKLGEGTRFDVYFLVADEDQTRREVA